MKIQKCLFWAPFLASNFQTIGTITSKIDPNLPLVVLNLLVKIYRDPFPKTKVIVRKLNASSDDDDDDDADDMIALYDTKIFLRSYNNEL